MVKHHYYLFGVEIKLLVASHIEREDNKNGYIFDGMTANNIELIKIL